MSEPCTRCGKVHTPQPVIHICDMAEGRRRVRRRCPWHKRLCYGVMTEYYDTVRVSFNCGTWIDYGYGLYDIPQEVKRKRWRDKKRRHRANVTRRLAEVGA